MSLDTSLDGARSSSTYASSFSCPFPKHVFVFAGRPSEGRIPEGWECACGQTVARWKKCNFAHEHLVPEPKFK